MLWDRCIELGIETRKRLRELARHYENTGASAQEKWFFDPFVPDVVTIRGSNFTKEQFTKVQSSDKYEWIPELASHDELFFKLYNRLPHEFLAIRDLLLAGLWRRPL